MATMHPCGSVFVTVAVACVASSFAWANDEPARSTPGIERTHSLAHSLAGVDQNHDGIRDDIKAFVEREIKTSTAAPAAPVASPVKTELSSALRDTKKASPQPPRRTCFDYLMLEPKDQTRANQHMQTSAQNGTFGTHPCDPIVSPALERPFDSDVAELRLGPARLRTSE